METKNRICITIQIAFCFLDSKLLNAHMRVILMTWQAWILTNLAQVRPGNFVIDPFAGTGSLLLPSIALGALHVVAMDIQDSSQHSSKCIGGDTLIPGSAVIDSDKYASCMVSKMERVRANVHNLPFRDVFGGSVSGKEGNSGLFDVCICDPPYGLRKPRMSTKDSKDSPVESAEEMQAAVAAVMYVRIGFRVSFVSIPTFPLLCVPGCLRRARWWLWQRCVWGGGGGGAKGGQYLFEVIH